MRPHSSLYHSPLPAEATKRRYPGDVAFCWKRDTDFGRRALWPHGTQGA
jgi:hypothetical protein